MLNVEAVSGHWQQLLRARARPLDVVVLAEQLRDLLGAGLSVIEALDTLGRSASSDTSEALEQLTQRLRGGQALSLALSADMRFSALLVSLVKAAELTSDLPQALTRFIEHERRVAELRHRISSVAIYPLVLTGVGLTVLLFLLLYVIPRFARVFEGMNGALPWSARAMISWSHWLQAHGVWLLLAAGIAVGGLVALVGSPAVRTRAMQRLMQRGPLRDRLRVYFLSRWYRSTGMLVAGGIPLPEALALSNGVLPLGMRAGGLAVERALREGQAPARAHADAGMATPVAEQLILAGERIGDMGSVLTRIAHYHDAEVARSLERGVRVLEPLVMLLIGIGVGVVVVLMYMPIFELASALQ
ncbi:type II secretion system F family protein [Mitsuaria sp. WAJ17]|uniref:type II secretion system F family protein n=1 Tax=Mitsuaria sp. WAJ17 TaxID=2761452 RepID=UPI0015FFDC6F|nr:type II secretion system F family protein [Mitsuaria sp. WAJ17]MBB2486995.1 type II secretion system F family protein [Mitsuaria sp. WAJ17]